MSDVSKVYTYMDIKSDDHPSAEMFAALPVIYIADQNPEYGTLGNLY